MHLNCVITVVDRNNADFVNTMYEEVEIPLILTMLGSDPTRNGSFLCQIRLSG